MQQFYTSAATPGGLTVLLCIGKDKEGREHTASKRYAKNGHGFKKLSDYNMGWQFDAIPHVADDLTQLASLVSELGHQPSAVIVRGELDRAYYDAKKANPDYLIRRRKVDKNDGIPAHLTEVDRAWGMFDIDGYPLDPDDDLARDPESVIQRCIDDLLPEELRDATYFWQLSSSAGLVGGVLKVHLWFWCDRSHSNAYVRRWIKVIAPHLDHAPFSANQPHYIADPIVVGCSDPLPVRHGWLWREAMKPVVLSEISEPQMRERHERRQERLKGAGHPGTGILYAASIDDALAFLGDGEDFDGFHRPLLAAGMAYARLCSKGFPRNDRDFKKKLRSAIGAAPKRDDRGEAGVQKYLTDEYLDSQIAGAFRLVENVLRHEGIPNVPLPKRYGWAEGGLWFTPKAQKVNKDHPEPTVTPVWVCGFFNVLGRCQNGEGGQHGIVLRWRDEDNFEHTCIVSRRMLHEPVNAIAGMLEDGGLRCDFGAQKELRACLAWLKTSKALIAVERSGWHGDSFVLADGTVYGSDAIIMRPEHTRNSEGCATAGALADWRRLIGRYCVGNSRLMFYAAAALAGPLLDIVSEPSGGCHLHGPSSSGKSTAVFVAASIKGRGKHGAALHQWAATGNGLEALAELNSDGFLALDEIGQADAHGAGDSIYRLANESGKARMSKDITMRASKTWRIMFLSTGEVTLQQRMSEAGKRTMTGMEVRMANIPSDAGAGFGVFETPHGFDHGSKLADHLGTAAATVYGTPLRAFLERLVEMRRDDADGLYQHLKSVRAQFVADNVPPDSDGQVSRVAGRFGVIAAAGEMGIAADILCGNPGDAKAAAARCFSDWLGARGTVGSGEEYDAIRRVRHFLELHGASRFQEIRPTEFGGMQTPPGIRAFQNEMPIRGSDDDSTEVNEHWINNMAGYRKENRDGKVWYLITPEVWRLEVCKGMDAEVVAKAVHNKGWLDKGDVGHLTKQVRIEAKANPRRFFVVSADILTGDDEAEQSSDDE